MNVNTGECELFLPFHRIGIVNGYSLMYHFGERSSSADVLGKREYNFVDFIKCVVQLQLVLILFEITK